MSQTIQIAIDGPSGAGKSTMARLLAGQLHFVYVDTGAMYRAVGLYAQRAGIPADRIEAILPLLEQIRVELRYVEGSQRVLLNGEDVSEPIRTEQSSRYASAVSALPEVRRFLLDLQQGLAERSNVIMDGRDIGTVILPQAQVKIFLTASPEERARRRFLEQQQKGEPVTYEQVYQEQLERDRRDTQRAVAPLRPAEDAVILDATAYSLEETLERMKEIIREKTGYAV